MSLELRQDWRSVSFQCRPHRRHLSEAIRCALGENIPSWRCRVHKPRNILDRLLERRRESASVLRQTWDTDDAQKAEMMIRNLTRRMEQEATGVSRLILEGFDEILTVTGRACRRNCGSP